MDYHAKEEMVVDQFILEMGNYEFSMQVAAHGHRGGGYPRGGKVPSSRAQTQHPSTSRIVTDERDQSPNTKVIGEGHFGTSRPRW